MKTTYDDRLEQVFIGSLVINPGNIPDMMNEIQPKHFHNAKARTCYEVLIELTNEGVAVEPTAVSSRAKAKLDHFEDAFNFIVGAASLEGFNSVNVGEYAKQIKALWHERQKLDIASAIASNKVDMPTAMDLLANVSKELAQEWRPFTLADCYEPRPPVKYLAGNFFQEASLNIVYGAPACFKSFLLADLLVCVASGEVWLPPAPWQENAKPGHSTIQTPAMWIDFDNGIRRTQERFDALGKARDLPGDAPLVIYSMPLPWLQSTDRAAVGRLSLRIMQQGAGIVCIDNLGDILGDAEENSADMAKVMSNFRQVAEETKAAIILIHHQRKSQAGFNNRAGDNLRGHSSIEAALDLAFLVDREPYSDTLTVTCTKSRGVDILPFRAQFAYDKDTDGNLTGVRFYGLGIDDNASSMAIEKAIADILTEPMNKTAITKAVKEELPEVGLNRIRDQVDRMTSAGKLKTMAKNGKERIYSLG